jgi:hypothetical protein
MPLYPRDPQDLARAEEVAARVREAWRADPNVVQIAPGLKIASGRVVPDELVVTFFVRRKLPSGEVQRRGLRLIPPEVEGIPTDVEPIDAVALASPLATRRERRDPLMGGIAIGNGNIQFHFGTLGGIVFDNATGIAKALTNEHVLVNTNEGQSGDPVIQPAPPRLQDYIDLDFVPNCCPIGPIWFVQTGGPVSSFLAWLAVMAGVVALSDVRDPTRRGEDATVPAAGERTTSESVDVALEYPDFPIPGTPYRVDVDWSYTRVTTGASYNHNVTETNTNPNVLDLQRLATDRDTYRPGDTVHLLATLVSPSKTACQAFHTIAYLVPGAEGQQGRSHMVVLQPVGGAALRTLRRLFPQLRDRPRPQEECDDFADVQPGTTLPPVYSHRRLTYENLDPARGMRTVDQMPSGAPNGISELSFGPRGIRILLPFPANFVTAAVAQFTRKPVELRAYDSSGTLIGSATAPNIQGTEHLLEVRGSGIVNVTVSEGGGEGLLMRLCYGRELVEERCYYYGKVALEALDPLGPWRTHLFAQTINDVPIGTDPESAASTIGGMPVTRNFEYMGEGSVPPYGAGCIFRPSVDGDFEVVT